MDILVANIIDEYTVVLNCGVCNGINLGDKVIIYELSDFEIKDPATDKSLGLLEIPKGRGEVINLQDNLCTVRSTESRMVEKALSGLAIGYFPVRTKSAELLPFGAIHVGDHAKIIDNAS